MSIHKNLREEFKVGSHTNLKAHPTLLTKNCIIHVLKPLIAINSYKLLARRPHSKKPPSDHPCYLEMHSHLLIHQASADRYGNRCPRCSSSNSFDLNTRSHSKKCQSQNPTISLVRNWLFSSSPQERKKLLNFIHGKHSALPSTRSTEDLWPPTTVVALRPFHPEQVNSCKCSEEIFNERNHFLLKRTKRDQRFFTFFALAQWLIETSIITC